MKFLNLFLGFVFAITLHSVWASDEMIEPSGYRLNDYNAPVPYTLNGAKVVQVLDVERLLESESVIPIDVLPAQRKPEGLDSASLWLPPPHYGIPGSLWLPDVGRGEINDQLDQYFQIVLKRVTNDDLNVGLMFYCLPDCWMSWNAAKRAVDEYGYTNVYWFPEGITGWQLVNDQIEKLLPYEVKF